MGTFSVTVTNRLPQAAALIRSRIDQATRKAAFDIEGQAKSNCQQKHIVDTGNLMHSINAHGDGAGWRVDSPANYSLYIEFGTRYQPARTFLVPAAEYVKPRYIAALKQVGR